eukprot:gene9135-12321_t
MGKPFTLQFAMERVPSEFWTKPSFLMINYHVSYIWAIEFFLSSVLSLLNYFIYPHNDIARIIPSAIILIFAFLFTSHYPPYARKKLANNDLKSNMNSSTATDINDNI